MQTPYINSVHHCFVDRADGYFSEPFSELVRRSLFTLDNYDMSPGDFDGLWKYPPDCIEWPCLRPFVDLGRQEFDDTEGNHMFELSRFKTSLTAVFATVPESEAELFCWHWSQHWIYAPFQGWEHVSPEVARQKCQEIAFQKLSRFFRSFGPLCQDACAAGHAIYILWERHERTTA